MKRRWTTLVILAAALAVPAFASGGAHATGVHRYGFGDTGVVDVSNTPGYAEGEQPLSVNPTNPDQIIVVSNVFERTFPSPLNSVPAANGAGNTAIYTSQDGGRTWAGGRLDQGGLGRMQDPLPSPLGFAPEFDDALNIINSDADAAWDRHGNAWYESGDIHGVNHNGDETATVWRSTDGGRTWGQRVEAVKVSEEGQELDRPWFTVDNSGGPRDGLLYLTFETTPFFPEPPQVFVKTSVDHGATWSKSVRVDNGIYETQFNPRNRPVVGADGALYVVYDKAPITETPWSDTGPITLELARSEDGAKTFTYSTVDTNVLRVTSPDEATPGYVEMIPAIATDPTHAGRVAIAWPQKIDNNSSRILMRYSTDGGATWGDRIDVADDPIGAAPVQHDHVALTWTQDGRLIAAWRDRRCCGGGWDASFQQWARVFTPTGRSLIPGRTREFTEGPQRCTTGSHSYLVPDEFDGIGSSGGYVMLTWAQLAGEMTDVVFRRVPLSAFDG